MSDWSSTTSPPSTRYELTRAGERFVEVLGAIEAEVELVEGGCAEACVMITADPERSEAALAALC